MLRFLGGLLFLVQSVTATPFADSFGRCQNQSDNLFQIQVKIKSEHELVSQGLSSDEAVLKRQRALERIQSSPWSYLEYLPRLQIHSIGLSFLSDQNAVAQSLLETGDYEFIRRNCIYSPALTPDDAQYGNQYYLPLIEADDAWDFTTGTTSITVAIVDSGVDITQQDLSGRTVSGFNTFTCTPTAAAGCGSIAPVEAAVTALNDCAHHGTRVAAIAAATGNNAVGMAGINFAAQIMPVRISNAADCTSNAVNMAEGIIWAAEHGAKVINVSYSGVYDPTVQAASSVARSLGSLVVFAAGNNTLDLLVECSAVYSSAQCAPYTLDDILVVGATDSTDALAGFSNSGAWIDLVAPGDNIRTVNTGSTYADQDGTSFSAPIVSGAASLLFALFPDLNPGEVEDLLLQSSTDLGTSGEDDTFGYGRLDIHGAISLALSGSLNSSLSDNRKLDLLLPKGPAKIGMTDTPARGGSQSRGVIFTQGNSGLFNFSHQEIDNRRLSMSELPVGAKVGRGSLYYRKDDESSDFVFTNDSRTQVFLGSFNSLGGGGPGPAIVHKTACGSFVQLSDIHLTEDASGATLHLVVADKGADAVYSYTLSRSSETVCTLNASLSISKPEWIRSVNQANPRIYIGYRDSTGLRVRSYQDSDLTATSTAVTLTTSISALFGRPFLDSTNSDLWVPIAYANDSVGADYIARFTFAAFPPVTNTTVASCASPTQILQDYEGGSRLLYVLCPQHRKVRVLDTSGNSVGDISTTFTPRKIFVTSDGTYRYVAALRGDAKLSIFRASATGTSPSFSETTFNLPTIMDDIGGFGSLDEVVLVDQETNLISVADLGTLASDYNLYLPRGINALAAQSAFVTHFVSTAANSAYTLDELKNGIWRLTQYPVDTSPIQIFYRTNRLYTLNRDGESVTAIDLTDGESLELSLPSGARPLHFEMSTALDRIWTANSGTNSMTEINIANANIGIHGAGGLSEVVVQTVAIGFSPKKILYQSSDDTLYIAGPTQVRAYDGSAMTSVITQTLASGISDITLRTGGIWASSRRGPSVTAMDRSTFTTTALTYSPQLMTSNESVGIVGFMNTQQLRSSAGNTYSLYPFTKIFSSLTNLFVYNSGEQELQVYPYSQMASSGVAGSRIRLTSDFDITDSDTNGNIWLANSQQLKVQRVSSNLQVESVKDISRSLPIDIIPYAAENRIYVLSRNLNLLYSYDTVNGGMRKVSVCEAPTKMILDSVNDRLYVLCTQLSAIAVLALNDVGDVLTQTLYRTGSQPVDMVFDSTADQLFILNQGSDSVTIYDTSSLATAPTTVTITDAPSSMALDTSTGDLSIFHRATRTRTSLDGPSLVATTATIANFGFTRAAINSSTNTVYGTSISPKSIYATSTLNFALSGTALTDEDSYATEIGISPSQDKTYMLYPLNDMVRIFTESGASSTYRDVSVGDDPRGILVSDTVTRAYVSNFADDTVSVISTTTNAVLSTISLTAGCGPTKMALISVSGTNYVFTLCETNETIELFTAATYSVGTPVELE